MKKKILLRTMSYVLVALLASGATIFALQVFLRSDLDGLNQSKLEEASRLIQERFVGETDVTAMEDAAVTGMIASLGDEWSYYISAADYDSYMDQMSNSYVGVGITIKLREDGYLDIIQVVPNGPAMEAGILPGDILIAADGADCAENGLQDTKNLVRGEEGTSVTLTVRRNGKDMDISVIRRHFDTAVAEGKMLEENIGYIAIYNFDDRCYQETRAAIDALLDSGAEALLFDVRNNPGGYKHELVKILDDLLPEGEVFHSEYYDGTVDIDRSDAKHIDLPMAVLVNQQSYSAAEFFAAALREYDAAFLVGEQTYGKGYFQQTYRLQDGSAIGLSVGKYFTPDGENLAGVGLTPDIEVPVDEQTENEIYTRVLKTEEDPQILVAIDALKSGKDLDE